MCYPFGSCPTFCVEAVFCFAKFLSTFTNYNVFSNANANPPLVYKMSRTGFNQEGNLLLWPCLPLKVVRA